MTRTRVPADPELPRELVARAALQMCRADHPADLPAPTTPCAAHCSEARRVLEDVLPEVRALVLEHRAQQLEERGRDLDYLATVTGGQPSQDVDDYRTAARMVRPDPLYRDDRAIRP